jgi:hypothetical protein
MHHKPNFICVDVREFDRNDYGVSEFALGSRGKFVSVEEMLLDCDIPRCWAGFYKTQWHRHCVDHGLSFYNFDSAYFGNPKKKNRFRLSVNSFQNTSPLVHVSRDRWFDLGIELESFSRGSSCVIVPPDRKKCELLGLGTPESWTDCVIAKIRQHTDRPIRIRSRPESRLERLKFDSFRDYISTDTHCVIGHSSNALIESAMCSVPVIALGDSAVSSLYSAGLESVDTVAPVDQDHLLAWLAHLSYSQFTREELRSGFAWDCVQRL